MKGENPRFICTFCLLATFWGRTEATALLLAPAVPYPKFLQPRPLVGHQGEGENHDRTMGKEGRRDLSGAESKCVMSTKWENRISLP